MDIDLGNVELPNDILKFGYSINYKYMGKVSHPFDRFYIITKLELPKIEDLNCWKVIFSRTEQYLTLWTSFCQFPTWLIHV